MKPNINIIDLRLLEKSLSAAVFTVIKIASCYIIFWWKCGHSENINLNLWQSKKESPVPVMLPAHYNPKMSSPPNPWLEDVTGSSMAKCDNLNPHYNVMTSVSPSASSLNVSQQNWDRQFQLYFNGI